MIWQDVRIRKGWTCWEENRKGKDGQIVRWLELYNGLSKRGEGRKIRNRKMGLF